MIWAIFIFIVVVTVVLVLWSLKLQREIDERNERIARVEARRLKKKRGY